jgi:disulfide bond formation protein DsbB
MATPTDRILRRWPAWALAAALALLAIAHAFQTFGRLEPCHLCLEQRTAYWWAAAIALVGLAARRLSPAAGRWPWVEWLLALAFLSAAAIAIQQAGAEWKWWTAPESCSGATTVTAADIARAMQGTMTRAPRCDEAPWRLLGLSMAGWDALAALALAALSVAAALRRRRPA